MFYICTQNVIDSILSNVGQYYLKNKKKERRNTSNNKTNSEQ